MICGTIGKKGGNGGDDAKQKYEESGESESYWQNHFKCSIAAEKKEIYNPICFIQMKYSCLAWYKLFSSRRKKTAFNITSVPFRYISSDFGI